ncbi:MAG: hypothetical protein VKK98_03065 [Cyanobacteriota bacterium]|nr:hypothetical protein [Cyanobacteriota bacterium]
MISLLRVACGLQRLIDEATVALHDAKESIAATATFSAFPLGAVGFSAAFLLSLTQCPAASDLGVAVLILI